MKLPPARLYASGQLANRRLSKVKKKNYHLGLTASMTGGYARTESIVQTARHNHHMSWPVRAYAEVISYWYGLALMQ